MESLKAQRLSAEERNRESFAEMNRKILKRFMLNALKTYKISIMREL